MKDRYTRNGALIEDNHQHSHNSVKLSDKASHLYIEEVDRLVGHLNDKEDLIDELNKEEQRLVNIISKDKDEIADLKRKNDRLQYIIIKQKQLLAIYNEIWQYIEEFK